MHIVHIYKNYWPIVGGIENHIRLLAEGQAKAGHRVTVLVVNTARRTTVEEMNGVQVIKAARLATAASTPLSIMLPLWLRRLRPDVAHLHFPYPLGEVAQFLLGRAKATVLTYHSDIIRQKTLLRFYRPLMLRVLEGVSRIIATSPQYVASSEVLQR
ncbi:MAG: glycosyltransferase, partial [Chloroflexi bacterium]|nr:glycosyltransferase [Chloroflexota bacterium]